MLLEDDETQTSTHKTLTRCSKTPLLQNDIYPTAPCALNEILPRPPCVPSFNKSRFFRILQFTYLLTSLHFLNSFYVYTRGILGCLLGGPKPCGGNSSALLMKQKLWFIITWEHFSTIILTHPEQKQNIWLSPGFLERDLLTPKGGTTLDEVWKRFSACQDMLNHIGLFVR